MRRYFKTQEEVVSFGVSEPRINGPELVNNCVVFFSLFQTDMRVATQSALLLLVFYSLILNDIK